MQHYYIISLIVCLSSNQTVCDDDGQLFDAIDVTDDVDRDALARPAAVLLMRFDERTRKKTELYRTSVVGESSELDGDGGHCRRNNNRSFYDGVRTIEERILVIGVTLERRNSHSCCDCN